jgi:hypothetical protein
MAKGGVIAQGTLDPSSPSMEETWPSACLSVVIGVWRALNSGPHGSLLASQQLHGLQRRPGFIVLNVGGRFLVEVREEPICLALLL